MFLICGLLIGARFINIAYGASSGEGAPLSDVLRWKYEQTNLNCTGPRGGRNPCQDVRSCNFAVASLILGGKPTFCGWVEKSIPRVCCGLPLVFGGDLMAKVEAEKSRKRECGRRTMSERLSETENEFFNIVNKLPPPPMAPDFKPMVSPVGGSRSRQGDFPWMVAIFRGSTLCCGGSLIDRVHVLTAAHCFMSSSNFIDPSIYTVRVGNINVDMGYPFTISSIKIHEDYVPTQHYNDIAIMTLSTEILTPLIAHICLPNEELQRTDFTKKNTTLLGWGDMEFGGQNAPSLHIVDDIPVVSNEECRAAYATVSGKALPFGINDNFICAGLPEGGKDACQQDSGGPLMYKYNPENLLDFHTDIPWVLVGIVSFGFDCGEPGYPGVYTRVSSFMDWIVENTKSPHL